jgi:sugar-specific transcriptional regulator TrmB
METEENKAPEAQSEEKKPEPPKWEYRQNFGINNKMKEVIEKTVEATEAELSHLRKKLEKLQYGA